MFNFKNIIGMLFMALGSFIVIFGAVFFVQLSQARENYLSIVILTGMFLIIVGIVSSGWVEDKRPDGKPEFPKLQRACSNLKKQELIILLFGFLGITLVGAKMLPFDLLGIVDSSKELSEFGDYFGGLLGPILSALTLVFIIQQNDQVRKWEERVERERVDREEKLERERADREERLEKERADREHLRDNFEVNKLETEMFLRKIDYLTRKLREISNSTPEREITLSVLEGNIRSPRYGENRSDNYHYSELKILTGEVLSFVKLVNTTIQEIFWEAYASSTVSDKNKIIHHYRNLKTKYDFLTSFTEKELISSLNFVVENQQYHSGFNIHKNSGYVRAINEYLNRKDELPDFYETEEIHKIWARGEEFSRVNTEVAND